MTLSQRQRQDRPATFAKRDARTAIYKAILGPAATKDPQGDPLSNEHRKRPENWSFFQAQSTVEQLYKLAAFPPKRLSQVADALNRGKSKGTDPWRPA